jgi:SAM-dependent methyltransferase
VSQDAERSETAAISDVYAARRERSDPADVVDFVLAERRSLLRAAVDRLLPVRRDDLRICDVGCGAGGDLESWARAGVAVTNLAGTELLAEPLNEARRLLPDSNLRLVNDFTVPWPDGSFDVTSSSMAMSSILSQSSRRELFVEMLRVTIPGGVVAIYDFHVRKPTNRHVIAMNRKRIAALGMRPIESWRATPFLPLLKYALRLPSALRRPAIALLPRTHTLWIWQLPTPKERRAD